MLPTCKANGVPGETGWPPLLRLGWRKSGNRRGNGARDVLVATGETNGTKAAVILANQCGQPIATRTPSPPHRDDSNSEPRRAHSTVVG